MSSNLMDLFNTDKKKEGKKEESGNKEVEEVEEKQPPTSSIEIKPEIKPEPKEVKKPEVKVPEPVEIPKKTEKIIAKPSFIKERPIVTNTTRTITNDEMDLSPAGDLGTHTITVFGLKGSGKTFLSLSFPGTFFALTFDNKTQSVANENKYAKICTKLGYKNPTDKVTVFNGVRYYDRTSPDNWLKSADFSWVYINRILDSLSEGKLKNLQGNPIERPDWILIDGGEIVHTMLEMVMRNRNGLMAFQGISNRNVWKERRMYIETLLHRCQEIAKKGVIWTSYIQKDEIKEDGDFVSIQDVPKWVDAVLYETDVLIKTERKTGKSSQDFYATVESSKWDIIPETNRILVTDRGASAVIKNKKAI